MTSRGLDLDFSHLNPFGTNESSTTTQSNPIQSSRMTSRTENTNNERQSIDPAAASFQDLSALHDFTGPIIKLQVNNVGFRMPESHISKFASLNKLIKDSRRTSPRSDSPTIFVHGDSELASHFLKTFELLSASPVEPIDFSSAILVSAALISAAYDYPTLNEFCIKKLEELSLGSIERLRIGRSLDRKSWEERAYQELSERDEMITREEMLALGVDAYFQVASSREKRQRERVNKSAPRSAFRQDPDSLLSQQIYARYGGWTESAE
ncbi:hypothetical protein RSOL_446220 [Rhizoctonia solani AG-3 Rhs1AP]|uniref:BTB/POZ domain protein n=1 Tax=Rhizoctonia solani AG-3 Rhs1AP TaxID=1086054 RepID=X8JQI6_9AGAM|nr:hypothetical protein RSOL_446220 [Rhizoctonia solani AG-3 Rhs1AP]